MSREYPFFLALSHDVDRLFKSFQYPYYLSYYFIQGNFSFLKKEFDSLIAQLKGKNPYWNFDRIMQIEEELNVRSTFFFLNESGKVELSDPRSFILFRGRYDIRTPETVKIIKKLDSGGWEIGLHGSYYSYQNFDLLEREKKVLEGILGHSVKGVRQHYLNLSIPATWRIHSRLGFEYDSTLMSKDEMPAREYFFPYYPEDFTTKKEIRVLQIPLILMDTYLFLQKKPWKIVTDLINQAERINGILTINWHQEYMNPYNCDNATDLYVKIIRESKKRGAWVTTLGNVSDWYKSMQSSYIHKV